MLRLARPLRRYASGALPPDAFVALQRPVAPEQLTAAAMRVPENACEPLPDAYAVVHVGGHQYKVTRGDELMVDRLHVPVLARLLLDKVLLVGTAAHTAIGTPLLPRAKVLVEVQEHARTAKVIVFKKRKRSRSTRKQRGHRQPYTLLRVLDVLVEQ